MATLQKTIVLSDLHISNGASYSWFLPPYPKYLTAMLTDVANDSTVAELVLLGDIFDLWLYPLDVVPWTVPQILAANRDVTAALQRCARNIPNVYYMNGNHDLEVTAADLQPLASGGKSVQLVTPDQYNSHHQYQRHLEHGHAVDMFNAPDDAGDTIAGYPLGYFITRMVATAADQSAAWEALKRLLQALGTTHAALAPQQLEVRSMGSLFVEPIITLLEKLVGVDDSTPIRFADPALNYTVGDIKSHYGSLYSTWWRKYPNIEQFLSAMLTGLLSNGLEWYAKLVLAGSSPPKVLAMGHTHHAEAQGAYDNDGCWCIPNTLGHGDATPYYLVMEGTSTTLMPWQRKAA